MANLLLGKLLLLLHGEIVVGKLLLGKLLVGKVMTGESYDRGKL